MRLFSSLSLTLIQLLSTMHPGSSSYKIPPVQLMSVCTIFFSFRDILFVLPGRAGAGYGSTDCCECDSHCESESPHLGMWEGAVRGIPSCSRIRLQCSQTLHRRHGYFSHTNKHTHNTTHTLTHHTHTHNTHTRTHRIVLTPQGVN